MSSHTSKRRVADNFLIVVLAVALLVLCGAVISLSWRRHSSETALSEEQYQLITSLANSVSAKVATTRIRVGIFDVDPSNGNATKDLQTLLAAESTFAWKSVSAASIREGALNEFDVIIFPGGYAPRQAELLGDEGKEIVKDFVRAGGGYVGICGGAFLATAKYDCGMALINVQPLTGNVDVHGNGLVSMAARGTGTVKIELTGAGKRIFGDTLGIVDILYSGGPIFIPAHLSGLSESVPLATFRNEVWTYEPQRGTMVNTPAIIAGRFGRGRAIIFSPHPDVTIGLEFLVRHAILATASSGG